MKPTCSFFGFVLSNFLDSLEHTEWYMYPMTSAKSEPNEGNWFHSAHFMTLEWQLSVSSTKVQSSCYKHVL